jgi:dTDP-4-amino-4,6-dideoxygalactose transaminase
VSPARRVALLGGTTTWSDCALALRYLVDRDELVEGPALREYERAFAATIGVPHALSFASGRVALYEILRALGIGDGDEVLVQVPTHVVIANAIRYAGARPVFVDCSSDYNIDLDQAESRVTPRARALVLQHTFGVPSDLDGGIELARRHDLELIEDCVHALGATYRGKAVGSFGRAAIFSTEETKTITSTMGGMAVTGDASLATRLAELQAACAPPPASLTAKYLIRLVSYHALTEPHVHRYSRTAYELLGRRNPLPRATSSDEARGLRPPGYEQRLGNAQAALALRQLRRLEVNLAHRRAIASAYAVRLAERGFEPVRAPEGADPAFVRYPVWVDDRAAAVRRVAPLAVVGTWFTSVLEEAEAPALADYEPGSCPRAEAVARHLVNLPTHPRVRERDVDGIVARLATAGDATGSRSGGG